MEDGGSGERTRYGKRIRAGLGGRELSGGEFLCKGWFQKIPLNWVAPCYFAKSILSREGLYSSGIFLLLFAGCGFRTIMTRDKRDWGQPSNGLASRIEFIDRRKLIVHFIRKNISNETLLLTNLGNYWAHLETEEGELLTNGRNCIPIPNPPFPPNWVWRDIFRLPSGKSYKEDFFLTAGINRAAGGGGCPKLFPMKRGNYWTWVEWRLDGRPPNGKKGWNGIVISNKLSFTIE